MAQLRIRTDIYRMFAKEFTEAGLEFRYCNTHDRYEKTYTCKRKQASDAKKIKKLLLGVEKKLRKNR